MLSRRKQRPVRGIAKLHVELSRVQAEIGIPIPALAYIQQAISRLGEHIAGVAEAQFQVPAWCEGRGKHDGDEVVAPALQLRSFNRGILDEVERSYTCFAGFDSIDLEMSRQFKEQRSFSSILNSQTHFGGCAKRRRRLHGRPNLEGRDRHVARGSIRGRDTGRERRPDIEEEGAIFYL